MTRSKHPTPQSSATQLPKAPILTPEMREAMMTAYHLTKYSFAGVFTREAVFVSHYYTEFIDDVPNICSPLTPIPVLAEVPPAVAQFFSDTLIIPEEEV